MNFLVPICTMCYKYTRLRHPVVVTGSPGGIDVRLGHRRNPVRHPRSRPHGRARQADRPGHEGPRDHQPADRARQDRPGGRGLPEVPGPVPGVPGIPDRSLVRHGRGLAPARAVHREVPRGLQHRLRPVLRARAVLRPDREQRRRGRPRADQHPLPLGEGVRLHPRQLRGHDRPHEQRGLEWYRRPDGQQLHAVG